MACLISVIVCTHNPRTHYLRRVLAALEAQTLPLSQWELLLVDNASSPLVDSASVDLSWHPHTSVLREPQLGLTRARLAGLSAARGALVVLVDDDNLLAPNYLAASVALFDQYDRLGAAGGKSVPEWEQPPEGWVGEFTGTLALRDLGPEPLTAAGVDRYPPCAPIGAGMVLRRTAVAAWLDRFSDRTAPILSDRRGADLSSGGDNDIVLAVLAAGWEVGYFPHLELTHLIPASRATRDYLGRLNHGIWRSWVQVLDRHGIRPWSPIPRWTVPVRKLRAYWRYRAWRSPAHFVRWRGACGAFEGRSLLAPHVQQAERLCSAPS